MSAMNNIAQSVECIHVNHEAIRLTEELVQNGQGEIIVAVTPCAGEGVGAGCYVLPFATGNKPVMV